MYVYIFVLKSDCMTDYKAMILVRKYKSQWLGLLLTGIFGGLGLFYSTLLGGIIIGAIEFVIGYFMGKSYSNTAYLYGSSAAYAVFGKFLIALLVVRGIALFISYGAISSHNEDIDAEILLLSEPKEEEKQREILTQLEEADKYVNGDNSSDTIWLIAGLSFAFILVIVGLCYYGGNPTKELSTVMESAQDSDILNTEYYIVNHDTAWVHYSASANDISDLYYKRDDVITAIKERNGFIYISAYEAGTTNKLFGWVDKNGVKSLGGCMH